MGALDPSASWIARHFPRRERATPMSADAHYFWAFISYSHADETWAKWIHQGLERYRLPKTLVGRQTSKGIVPRRLMPVFLDRNELPGSPSLKREIELALERSRALLVVCSPHSAVSRYVDEEIRAFKRRGRESDVFCLLVDGEPNATDKPESGLLEAFPAAIRFRVDAKGALIEERVEPLAADARKGKDGLGVLQTEDYRWHSRDRLR